MEATVTLGIVAGAVLLFALGRLVANHADEKYDLGFVASWSFACVAISLILFLLAILFGTDSTISEDNILVLQYAGLVFLTITLLYNGMKTNLLFGVLMTFFQFLTVLAVVPLVLLALAAMGRLVGDK